ncbi:nitrate reductase molybdenum cofactor assembly chaperone [Ramlibacter tataouinensis]|uniref:nitrate reductase molybdenum cofactor assembly chaperone n=1 Tax=Ramlibacter tataouinensis TaxID=94132 RepID=UPI0022F3BE22|nr:nitrate reductase molybdenum cofactor assembly chaperone [Ramlibacter tataouinensis]WBY02506.1 nitrate reductase molybdenum cofactor assembly chaperone [Ramlibacter tataouinensis]
MRLTAKALSALLGYPSAELQAAVPEIRAALETEGALGARELRALEPLLVRLSAHDIWDLQEHYSSLFDSSGALSLHLFEHVHGESRERGQALVDLARRYQDHGFLMQGSELPDYLPLFLEFVSFLPPGEAREWLGQPAHVFGALAERLQQRGTPYAAVFTALLELGAGAPDPQALDEVRQRLAAHEAKSLDEVWQEEPVTFSGAPAPQAAGGLVQRLKAAMGR